MLSDKQIDGAFVAWTLAIRNYEDGMDIDDLAAQFGRDITTPTALSEVKHWFNWAMICHMTAPKHEPC